MSLRLLSGAAAATLVAAAMTMATAAQPAQTTRRIPQFENEHVRVWKSIIMPDQPLAMHRHDHPRAIIALRGGTLTIVQESGEEETVTWETGRAYWLEADLPGTRHGDVNRSGQPIEVMVVEMTE